MGFLKKLGNLFAPPSSTNNARDYWITVRCKRCGEIIRARIDLWNELSLSDSDAGDNSTYTSRKIIMGSGTCFQRIEVVLKFNSKHKLQDKQITGGDFIET